MRELTNFETQQISGSNMSVALGAGGGFAVGGYYAACAMVNPQMTVAAALLHIPLWGALTIFGGMIGFLTEKAYSAGSFVYDVYSSDDDDDMLEIDLDDW